MNTIPPPPPQGSQFPPHYDDRDFGESKRKVEVPAIILMVMAGLGLILHLLALSTDMADPEGFFNAPGVPELIEEYPELESIITSMTTGLYAQISAVAGLFVAVLIFLGAMKMRQLQGYGLAMTGAILAVIPCFSPCCCLEIPFGIWALVVLLSQDVKDCFT